MSDIDNPLPKGNFLTGKLGPLPVWAWGAILGGLVLGVYLLRNRGAASTAGQTEEGSALDTIGYTTTGLANKEDDTTSDASGEQRDNQSWLSQAISGTANALSASPAQVSSVLSRYLFDGGSFNATEQKYIDKAINLYGAPPQGTGGSSSFTGGGTSGGSTGANVANPYTFVVTANAWYFLNSNTGKRKVIANSADKSALQAYVASLGKGSKTPVSATVLGYIAAVS